jgi:uncharacterized membrane protein
MTKKRLMLLGSVALIVVLVASLAGATLVSADEPTTTPRTNGWGRGFGRGVGGQAGLEAAAELLGMTADELAHGPGLRLRTRDEGEPRRCHPAASPINIYSAEFLLALEVL